MPDSVTMSLTLELLQTQFPDAKLIDLKRAIKYQDKFQYTAANIKCINPSCSLLRKWQNSTQGFSHTCGNDVCKMVSKSEILEIMFSKQKTTNLERFGFEYNSCSPLIKEKKKLTSLKNYGVDHPSKIKETRLKAKQTYLTRTGYKHTTSNPEAVLKTKATNSNKYGAGKNHLNKHITNFEHWDDTKYWAENFLMADGYLDIGKCMNHFNCTSGHLWQRAQRLNIQYKKFKGTSLKEQQLANYILGLGYEVETNNRRIIKPLELDIYIPALKLAVEYNGLYWHSTEAGTDMYYHQQKSLACITAGISLVHIYETDTYEKNISKIQDAIKFKLEPRATELAFSYVLDTGCYPESINLDDYLIIEPKIKTGSDQFQVYDSGQLQLRSTQNQNLKGTKCQPLQ